MGPVASAVTGVVVGPAVRSPVARRVRVAVAVRSERRVLSPEARVRHEIEEAVDEESEEREDGDPGEEV